MTPDAYVENVLSGKTCANCGNRAPMVSLDGKRRWLACDLDIRTDIDGDVINDPPERPASYTCDHHLIVSTKTPGWT